MPRPVCPNMTTAVHLGPPGPRRHRDGAEAARRVARTGRAAIRCQESIFPRARHGRSCLGAAGLNSGHLRGTGPPKRALCQRPVSTSSWRYGLRRTCRLVTGRSHRPRSTWPDQARLVFLAVTHGVTHRYKRTHCLWLEQFQIAESARVPIALDTPSTARRTSSSGSCARAAAISIRTSADGIRFMA